MSTAIDELNEQLIQSIETLPSDFDLEKLSSRSFLYSFCGIEDYTLCPTSDTLDTELSLRSDFLTWTIETSFASLPEMDVSVLSGTRKLELEEADLDMHTRTRTSSGTGILPSFNCLSNLDLRAQRTFREYRSSRGYDSGSNTPRNRSMTVSSMADVERKATDRRRTVTAQDTPLFSGTNHFTTVFDVENPLAQSHSHSHKDTPKSPLKSSGLSNRDINVSNTPALPTNLFSFASLVKEPYLESPFVQFLAESTSSIPTSLETSLSFPDTLSSSHPTEPLELHELPSNAKIKSPGPFSSPLSNLTSSPEPCSEFSTPTIKIKATSTSSSSDSGEEDIVNHILSSPLGTYTTRRNSGYLADED